MIIGSKVPEDPSHAENVLHWLLVLDPDANEVLQLAAYGHDIERALPDRYTVKDFETYEDYKNAHAKRGGELITKMLLDAGYSQNDAKRAGGLVTEAEFSSDDSQVQLICDADTISFFDNNLAFYRKRYESDVVRKKVNFMYSRATDRAKKYVEEIIRGDTEIESYISGS